MIYPSLFIPNYANNAEMRLSLLRRTKIVLIIGLMLYGVQLYVLENYFYFFEFFSNLIIVVNQNNFDLPVLIVLLYVFRPLKEGYTFMDDAESTHDVNIFKTE